MEKKLKKREARKGLCEVKRGSISALQSILEGNVKKKVATFENIQHTEEAVADDDDDGGGCTKTDGAGDRVEDKTDKTDADRCSRQAYHRLCAQIATQLMQHTGVQVHTDSNLSYEQYCQLRPWLDSPRGENNINIVYRPQIIVINTTELIEDGQPPGDDAGSGYAQGDNDNTEHNQARDADKAEDIRVCNEEIFVYANTLALGLPQQQ